MAGEEGTKAAADDKAKFLPRLWRCACGEPNEETRQECKNCGKEKAGNVLLKNFTDEDEQSEQ